MTNIGDVERKTQNSVMALFRGQLKYNDLGNWEDEKDNSNIEEEYLREYLIGKKHYDENLVSKAIYELRKAADNLSEGLYAANKRVYGLLRYGVKVKAEAGENFQTVELIDWEHPENNIFGVAEEVSVSGVHDKRPDIVIYVNGIALAVIELKRSSVSLSEGIRQSIVNQNPEFIESFFSTIQFVFAGNETQGLRYSTIRTDEKHFLAWKEAIPVQNQLHKYLGTLCEKKRFLEIIHEFVLFDGGIKKICRAHQYFAVKAAQEHVRRREGGIIWHTQGSGKSLVMVYVARWLLEHHPHARVVVLTDRDELDKQIERVFTDAGEEMPRTRSGRELMEKLGQAHPRMLCSLVHKFGRRGEGDFDDFVRELEASPVKTVGEIFVFVDECHRTQSGKLHKAMKAVLRNAVFFGFTGTPLLRKDRKTSLEVFGRYIHTYKYNEGVADKVVLDLVYEARDIDQKLTSKKKVDEWFEVKTKGLNDFQKAELKKRWGTLQKVLSSATRLERIVGDVVFDFNTKPRLSGDFGNAILIASSIHQACRYYELFQSTELKGKCALITSYNPSTRDIVTEDTGANTETEKEYIYDTYQALLAGKSTETYEDAAKDKFIKEPAAMKLLIVVDKLLTGFDAPPCTYLYIDKSMQDHGLFQAICRVNRLDTEDKQFGYIVDYKDLFRKVESAVAVYTSDLAYDDFRKEDVDVMLKDRLKAGKERLDSALEEMALLCEPVPPPRDLMAHIRYFCGDPEKKEDLKKTEARRTALYKNTVAVIRAYANISADMEEAGYSKKEIEAIDNKVDHYLKLREEIKLASGEYLDIKAYEADMRHLIDTYIQAKDPKVISPFGDTPLIDIIVNSGIAAAINSLPPRMRNENAAAEAIENNIRRKILEEHMVDPAFFDKMSKLLDEIIKERRRSAGDYKEYLKKIADLCKRINNAGSEEAPESLKTRAQHALYNNVKKDEKLALALDAAVLSVKKAGWRGNLIKEREIKRAIYDVLKDENEVERLFLIIKEQSDY